MSDLYVIGKCHDVLKLMPHIILECVTSPISFLKQIIILKLYQNQRQYSYQSLVWLTAVDFHFSACHKTHDLNPSKLNPATHERLKRQFLQPLNLLDNPHHFLKSLNLPVLHRFIKNPSLVTHTQRLNSIKQQQTLVEQISK